MPIFFDHLVAALLLVVWPTWIAIYGRDGEREIAEDPSKRLRAYRVTMAMLLHMLVDLTSFSMARAVLRASSKEEVPAAVRLQ